MSEVQPTQIRDTQVDPPWLQGENGARYLYSIRLMLDLLLEKQNEAIRARAAGQGTDSALAYLASDRRLVRGPSEVASAFATRVNRAFETWAYAGSRRAVIEQVAAYLQADSSPPQVPSVEIVSGNADWDVWATAYNTTPIGDPPAQLRTSAQWDWGGFTGPWWQWLIVFPESRATGLSGTAASISQHAWDTPGGANVAGVWVPANTPIADGPFVTVSGLHALTDANVGMFLVLSSAASSANDGSWQITEVVSAGVCRVAMPVHVAPDANNGSLHWSITEYPFIGPGPVWGTPGTAWGDLDRSIGLSVAPAVVESIRSLVRTWKSAGAYYQSIIFAFDGGSGGSSSMFSPYATYPLIPNGVWANYGQDVDDVWVPSRVCLSSFDCFADGTGRYVQCSVHNVT